MNYGFVIDNRKCIGCHACSTACKSENEVPLGVNRTWVKYVERGAYPNVRRTFQVTRCNHCENPPCVRICPVGAMYQREDGIVEFDSEACIGCKACMQACPYDAIYIDPNTHTAAKCHFCAHRIDVGLDPACSVVCPTGAIVAGDLDDPNSAISQLVSAQRTTVRKPEQGTAPKVLYIDGEDVALHPTALASPPKHMLFADVISEQGEPTPRKRLPVLSGATAPSGHALRAPRTQGVPETGPIRVAGGRQAEHMVQVAFNAQHSIPWHWPVPAYLVTKGIGAGAFGFLAAGLALGLFPVSSAALVWGGLVSVVAMLATTALLVYDLERPERFLSILLRPQWKSWLTRGAVLLVAFSTLTGLWWGAEALGLSLPEFARTALAWATLPLAVGAAVYTAFLFAQAEGRDLWQSPLLPIHLVVQAAMLGSGTFLLLGLVQELPPELVAAARLTFGISLGTDLFLMLAGEFGVAHPSEVAARAAHAITHGRHARHFWWGSVLAGHVVALLLLAAGDAVLAGVAFALAVVGLYFYERAFVMAAQEVVNS